MLGPDDKSVRRCYICSSTSHLAKFHNKDGVATGARNASFNNSSGHMPRYGRAWLPLGGAVNAIGTSSNETAVKFMDDCRPSAVSTDESNSAAQCNKIKCIVNDAPSTAVRMGDLIQNKTAPIVSHNYEECVSVKLAELHYLKVNLFGADYCWNALVDGGSEVDVVNRAKLKQLAIPHEVVGEIALRPMAGPSIQAQLVKLQVRISPESECSNQTEYVSIVAAACDDLHDELILSEPTIQLLIDSCHRHVNLSDGETDDSLVVDVRAVTRGMARSNVDGPDSRLGDDLTHIDVTSDNSVVGVDPTTDEGVICVDDGSSFVNSDTMGGDLLVGDSAEVSALAAEQAAEETLKTAFSLARRNKGGYTIKHDVLFHTATHYGQTLTNLVVPAGRRIGVLKIAHNSMHWAAKKTKQRVILSGLIWPTLASEVVSYCGSCSTCQMRARQLRTDKVPISIGENAAQGQVFAHMHCDVFGPILPNQNVRYNYALIVVDSMSRYPFACPLRSLHAKNICDALLSVFEFTGISSSMVLTMDNASYFRSALTKEFLKRIGISPLFSTEYHPEGNAIAERHIGNIKSLIAKLASEKKRAWVNYLGSCLWPRRETVNGTTHVPPHLLVFGSLPRGPLAIPVSYTHLRAHETDSYLVCR